MQIFYCILLVIVIFFTVMEIVSGNGTNILVHTDNHKYHLCAYVIIFLVIASLLAAERYM
jgi:hypothetical protein